MTSVKRILSNALSLFGSQIITRAIAFFIVTWMIRYLSVTDWGIYSTAIAFIGLFSFIVDLGLSQFVIREISKDKSQASTYLGNFLMIQVMNSTILFIALAIITHFVYPDAPLNFLILLAGISIFFNAISIPFGSITSAFEKMHFNSLANVLPQVVNAFVIIYGIQTKQSLTFFIIAFVLTSLINMILAGIFCTTNCVKPKFKIETALWKKLFKYALPFALLMGFNVIYNRIDITMLSKIKGDDVVALYSSPYKLINALLFIPLSLSAAIFPLLSREQQNPNIKKTLNKTIKYITAIGIPLGLGTTLFASDIIIALFKEDYVQSIITLQILIWSVTLLCFYSIVTHHLVAVNKVYKLVLANLAGVIINIGLNIFLIKIYAHNGAAIATICSEITLMTICYIIAREYLDLKSIFKNSSIIIFITIIMGTTIIIFQFLNIHFVINIIIAALIYFILYYSIGLSKEEKIDIKNLITIKK